MTFEKYMAAKGIKLKNWQLNLAHVFLAGMYPYREMSCGKTFLLKHLAQFINEHGNEYEI